jgi:ParB/RepB/Spo0J family partition protein
MDELVASIKSIGIIQPPTVRKNGAGFDVLWGNRRVIAAKKAGLEHINCVVVELDDQAAQIAATAENMVRAPLDPMDQFEAFDKMRRNGTTVEAIATTFGIDELIVLQRLRLADLDPAIKKAYRDEKIDIEACMAMTLGTPKQQKTLLKNGTTENWMIKRELAEGRASMTEALFDPLLYTGELVNDLFEGDDVMPYALDVPAFHKLQYEACEALVAKDVKKGWAFAIISDERPYDLKKFDGNKVERRYVNAANTGKEDRKAYGVVYHLHPTTCAVQITHGWQFPKAKPAKTAKEKTKTTADNQTINQQRILATAYKDMFRDQAKLEDALMFYMMKHVSESDRKKTVKWDSRELHNRFINQVMAYASDANPDHMISTLQKKNRWSLRKSWVPSEEFLKPYSQDQLAKIAKQIGVKLSGHPKKAQKVATLTKAFATTDKEAAKWLP